MEARIRFERYSRWIMFLLAVVAMLFLVLSPRPVEPRANAFDALGRVAVVTAFLALAWSKAKSRSIEIRRELPLVLAGIGTLDAQQTLVACLLEPDTSLRFRVIQGLNRLRELHPEQPLDRQSVTDALHAEIWGQYRLYQNLGALGRALSEDALVLANVRDSIEREQERIFRLMGKLKTIDLPPSTRDGNRQ